MPNYYPTYQPYPTVYPSYSAPAAPAQPSGILWVRGATEAQAYPVAPNNAVALWDSTAPVIYLKQADASGRPGMKIFDLSERAETTQNAGQGTDMGNSENAVKQALALLNSTVEEMKQDIRKLVEEKEAKA